MGKLLCEKKLRDVWCRNESVRAEIGPILQTHTHTHTHTHASPIVVLAGLPGFARDSCSIIMSICAFHFYIIYFHFFSADHGIPQTFDYILTT